ncbi:unnamed protein product [Musa acuminata var. zebrina]
MDGPDGFTAHAHTQPSPASNSHTIPTPLAVASNSSLPPTFSVFGWSI